MLVKELIEELKKYPDYENDKILFFFGRIILIPQNRIDKEIIIEL